MKLVKDNYEQQKSRLSPPVIIKSSSSSRNHGKTLITLFDAKRHSSSERLKTLLVHFENGEK